MPFTHMMSVKFYENSRKNGQRKVECYIIRPAFIRFYGVMVSTQDFESCDPSSNLGRT